MVRRQRRGDTVSRRKTFPLLSAVRRAEQAHNRSVARLLRAEAENDAAFEALRDAERALDRYCYERDNPPPDTDCIERNPDGGP